MTRIARSRGRIDGFSDGNACLLAFNPRDSMIHGRSIPATGVIRANNGGCDRYGCRILKDIVTWLLTRIKLVDTIEKQISGSYVNSHPRLKNFT